MRAATRESTRERMIRIMASVTALAPRQRSVGVAAGNLTCGMSW